ncbi:UvrB/UvrC motif-containing protein [Ferroacidibacillus organovorans]
MCEQCGNRTATVHFTEIVQGEKNEFHLCETCAKEKGYAAYQFMTGAFSVNQLLSGLMNLDPAVKQRAGSSQTRCESCGLTFSQFSQIGRFGCAHCYEAFAPGLNPMLKKIQSSNQHVGKVPKRQGGTIAYRRELTRLRQELQTRIQQEQFEEAARLRDQIRELETRVME